MQAYLAKRELVFLCVSSFFVMMGMGVVAPILPQYALTFGVSYTVAGLTISAFAIARIFINSPAGMMVGRVGRKKTILVGMILVGFGTLFCGLSQNIYQLIIFRIVHGAGSAFFILAANVMVTDLAPINERAKYLSYFQATFRFGAVLGPAFGGFLAELIDMRAPFFALSVFSLVGFALSLTLIKESQCVGNVARPTEIKTFFYILFDKRFLLVMLIQMISMLTTSGIRSTMIPIYGVKYASLSVTDIGLILSIGALFSLPFLLLISNYVDRIGRRPPLTVGLGLVGFGVLYFVLTKDFLGILTGILIMSLGQVLLNPSKVALVADYAKEEDIGIAYGVFRTAGDVGMFLGPILSGALLDRAGVVWPFFATSSLCWVTTAITFFRLKENQK